MAKYQKDPSTQIEKVRYRAICSDCKFKGAWQDVEEDAYDNAGAHRKKMPDHVIRVLTEQTLSFVLISA